MTDRPLARFHEGRLWLDRGMPDYEPADRFSVFMKAAVMRELPGEHAARKAQEAQTALDQYDRQNRKTDDLYGRTEPGADCAARPEPGQ